MATFLFHKKTDPTRPPIIEIVEHTHDTEQALLSSKSKPVVTPRWPRILSASIHVLVCALSIAVIGLGSHTLKGYSGTRGIHFGGVSISWPEDLNLHPIYIFLAVSALTLILSIPSTILTLRRMIAAAPFSLLEVASTMASLVLSLIWIAADFLQHHSESTPKKDLLSWACRRNDSPTNALVRYQSICQEQVR